MGPMFSALAVLGLAALLPGCRTVEATAEIPGNVVRTMTGTKPAQPPPDPVALQQEVFRLADEISVFAGSEYRRLKAKFPQIPEERLLESEVNLDYRLLEIASGPNSFANLIDMTFSIMLARHQVEVYVAPQDPEKHLARTIAALHDYEAQILRVLRETLGEEREALVRANITAWIEKNTTLESGLHARYPGPVSELIGADRKQKGALTNLFDSLVIDPFAGLDPTVRELTQTRLFAERALYVTQRMPKILQLELELFKRRTFAMPEVARLLENVAGVSQSVAQISATVEGLPALLHDEREGLTELVAETRRTFEAGSAAMQNLNTVVLSTDTFLGHLGVHEKPEPADEAGASAPSTPGSPPVSQVALPTSAPAGPAPEPFRIQDYTAAAAQLAQTAERVNALVTSLDRTLVTATSPEVTARVEAASEAAVAGGRGVVDYAFRRALMFVALACAMVVAAALGYRVVARRIGR